MKKLLNYSAYFFALFVVFNSCKKDNNNPSSTALTGILAQGTWRVTYFMDSGNNETNHFTGYTFQFNNDGSLSAVSSNHSLSGSWSDGNDDSQSKLIINFGNNPPFDDLNEDWHVTMLTSSTIKLEHISGGNGGTDLLHFEKN